MATRDQPPAPDYSLLAVRDLLDAFASNEPVPGGGSASALAGAVGVSLLMMVALLPKTRAGTPEAAADLAEASARLRPLRETLTSLVNEDSAAYGKVLAALRLPKDTDDEKLARREAVQGAMREATEVPMQTMRACQQALRGSIIVAANGSPSAATDTGIGIELLAAAVRGAAMNVDVNVRSLTDAAFVKRVLSERTELAAEAEADAARGRQLVAPR